MFSNKLIKYLAICLILVASLFAQFPNIVINEFLASNAHINYDPNYINYSDWVELHNKENYQINLNGYYLTDDLTNPTKWQITDDLAIEANGYLVFWTDNEDAWHHTNFQLNQEGEQIGIYTPDVSIIDTVTFNSQQTDISYGRNSNKENEWLYYYNPTPNKENNTIGYPDLINTLPPVFSELSGFYLSDLSLEITADPGVEIRYTLDGSEPDKNSEKYTLPLSMSDRTSEPNYFSEIKTNIKPYSWQQPWFPPINDVRKATIVRAKAFALGKMPSNIVTQTYFIGSELKNAYDTIPVISLVSDEKHLFSDSAGIYVPGITYDGRQGTGNYMFDWDRPAHVELFDEEGVLQLSQEVDIRTQGRTSQNNPQKGLHIVARDKYGKGTIDYPLFKNGKSKANKLTSFKRFMIRAWGSNWQYAMFSDAFAHTIYARSSLDIQDYQPVIVFINGEYWGLQEIREANKNPYYYQEHYGIDKDNPGVDILIGGANSYIIDEGDDEHWKNMVSYMENNDLSETENYEYIKTQMDVDNFIDYIGHTIYSGKFDWPGQNEAFWRPRTFEGRWKWIQYDMDTSFGLHGGIDSNYDMINHAIHGGKGNHGANPILNLLLKNQQFKIKFINWFMNRINSDFDPVILEKHLTEMVTDLDSFINEHRERWALRNNSWLQWDNNINKIYEYIESKPQNLITHLQTHFNLGKLNTIIINRQTEGGTAKINSLLINENTAGVLENASEWNGKYFEDVPISLIAIPDEGFIFDHWRGTFESQSDSMSFYLEKNEWLSPEFIPIEKVDSLLINEISVDNNSIIADSSGNFEDWIELYNASSDTINLTGIYFTDDFSNPTKWKIPIVDSILFNILPDEHKILWCDNDPEEGQDHLGFSLDKIGEMIGVTQIAGNDTVFIDSVSFSEQSPNVTYGRFPDASDKWEFLIFPTPGTSNVYKSIDEDQLNSPLLFQNYPNPFNVGTSIPFYLTDENDITIDIYDISGNRVRSLLKKLQEVGYHEILWDGKDAARNSVPSGVYFYRLRTEKNKSVKKMLFLK